LYALYDGHQHPYRVDFPIVRARRSRAASVRAYFDEYIDEQCHQGCRVLSTRNWKGWQVLSYVSDQFPNDLNDHRPSVIYGVMVETGRTEMVVQAIVPVRDRERGQAIVEKILQSAQAP
jgi:hypothetical protein